MNEELKFWGNLKKKKFKGGGQVGGGGVGLVGEVRVDVNKELKFLGKFNKKIFFFFFFWGGGGSGRGGLGRWDGGEGSGWM